MRPKIYNPHLSSELLETNELFEIGRLMYEVKDLNNSRNRRCMYRYLCVAQIIDAHNQKFSWRMWQICVSACKYESEIYSAQ